MNQLDLIRHLVKVLEELDIPYMIVGSLASGYYGEPRLTRDIDVVADLSYGHVPKLAEKFPADEFYFSPEAARHAIRTHGQFNIIHPTSGNKIDVITVQDSLHAETEISRRQRVRILPDQEGYAARAEDVIIAKMRAYSEGGIEKHLRDIAGIVKVSGEMIDRDYIEKWAARLGLTDVWHAILRRATSSDGGVKSWFQVVTHPS